MSKIKNIGMLDVRNIDEDLAEEITEIKNVGVIIESDESQVLLKNCKKLNVGTNLKLSKDENIKLIARNGIMKIDRDFLEGLVELSVIVVNGKLIFERDVDVELLNKKLYLIIANGKVVFTKKLTGIIQSKGTVNGKIIKYNNDYKFFDGTMRLTNKFLKSLRPNSKLAFEELLVTEEIDIKLLKEKISNIQILDRLIVADSYEEKISQYIDEYYLVNQIIVPNGTKGIKYIDDDICIDDNSIKKYDHNVLYVNGDVEVLLKDNVVFKEYIEHLICDELICNQENYDLIKDSINDDVEVKIIEGKLFKNEERMTLSKDFEEKVTIKNMGKLIFDEKLDYDKFDKNVMSIINYGLIKVPEDKLDIVKNKVKENHGKIESQEEESSKEELYDEEGLIYCNMGELKL